MKAATLKSNTAPRKSFPVYLVLAVLAGLAISGNASAAGLDVANNFLSNVQSVLTSAGVVVVTIAFTIGGYKVAFGGSTVREVTPIFIGGLLIGCAAALAGLLLG